MDVGSVSSANCNTSSTDNVLLLLFGGITSGQSKIIQIHSSCTESNLFLQMFRNSKVNI